MSSTSNVPPNPTQRRAPPIPHFISIYDYLTTLQPSDLSRLYESQASCLAVFRLLPELSRLIVNFWLFASEDSVIKREDIHLWFGGNDPKLATQALHAVIRLGILYPAKVQQENNNQESSANNSNRSRDNTECLMNPLFRKNLQNALCCNSKKGAGFGVQHHQPRQIISPEALDEYSKIRWETLLHFMVGNPTKKPPSAPMLNLLTQSGLMAQSEHDRKHHITHFGFQFLLQDPQVQVWELLLQYLYFKTQTSSTDPMELLNFYFLLSSLQHGDCYDASFLKESQRVLMTELKDSGLIYKDKKSQNLYYPTRLATSLGGTRVQNALGSARVLNTNDNSVAAPLNPLNSSQLDTNSTAATSEHFIILETNYNVYAYTDSPLHISILNLFLTLKCRFSNMVIGHLDRHSIRNALSKGITAEQVLQYLTAHAHPLMLRRTPVLPVTVVDQIRLWAIEKNRLYDQAGSLYRGFTNAADFKVLLNTLARRPEAVLWKDEKRLMMVVSQEGHRMIKSYYQEVSRQSHARNS